MATGDAVRWARQVRSERPPAALDEYLAGFEAFFDDYAARVDYWCARHPGYHEDIAQTARFHVPRGARVLEIGCGTGDLLASLEPSEGGGWISREPWSRRPPSVIPTSSSARPPRSGSSWPPNIRNSTSRCSCRGARARATRYGWASSTPGATCS